MCKKSVSVRPYSETNGSLWVGVSRQVSAVPVSGLGGVTPGGLLQVPSTSALSATSRITSARSEPGPQLPCSTGYVLSRHCTGIA